MSVAWTVTGVADGTIVGAGVLDGSGVGVLTGEAEVEVGMPIGLGSEGASGSVGFGASVLWSVRSPGEAGVCVGNMPPSTPDKPEGPGFITVDS